METETNCDFIHAFSPRPAIVWPAEWRRADDCDSFNLASMDLLALTGIQYIELRKQHTVRPEIQR